MKYICVYLILINILTFLVFGVDKLKAKYKGWRIKEITLFILSILGGSLGAYISMKLFSHKTNKFIFKTCIPFILMIQIIILWFTYFL